MVYEFSAKTVDDALTQASVELGVTSDELEYEVVEKGSSGILGFGSKDAVIRAAKKSEGGLAAASSDENVSVSKSSDNASDAASASVSTASTSASQSGGSDDMDRGRYVRTPASDQGQADTAKSFLTDMFKAMNLEVNIESGFDTAEGQVNIDLSGPEMGVIIGKRGQTLDAVQYLTNLAVNKKSTEYTKVKVDTEDYRRRRKETLENLARNVAYKVKRNHKAVSLEAMNPYERRVIHYALQNDRYVTTYSEGDEPYRHVVVTPKRDQ